MERRSRRVPISVLRPRLHSRPLSHWALTSGRRRSIASTFDDPPVADRGSMVGVVIRSSSFVGDATCDTRAGLRRWKTGAATDREIRSSDSKNAPLAVRRRGEYPGHDA